MKKIFKNILITSLFFSIVSCSNLLEQSKDNTQGDNKNVDNTTTIMIGSTKIKKTNGTRAASTNITNNADVSNLTDFMLAGKKSGDSDTEMTKLFDETIANLEILKNQKIMIEPGNWDFKLSAKLNGVSFSETILSKEIKEGENNKLTFVLKSDIQYGGLEVNVEWTNEANKVYVVIKDAEEENQIYYNIFTGEDVSSRKISFNKTLDDKLASGTYYIDLDFYNEGTITALNQYEAYVNIADGITTKVDISLDLNKTYKIEYENNGDNVTLAEGEVQHLVYSNKSLSFDLPEMKRPGYFWGGWYDNPEFSGTPIKRINTTTYGDKKFYAKWDDPILYVSGTGDDTTGDGTEEKPFATVNKACEKIIDFEMAEAEWTIFVDGTVTGIATETTGAALYAQSFIPDTVTPDNAKSILLKGVTPLGTNGIPVDSIDRGINKTDRSRPETASSGASTTGTALVINTNVPVTIENLRIANGNTDNSSSSNTDFRYLGGGLRVSSNSTVSLGDGVYFENNAACDGGAIYNAGTLYIYGTAFIGKKDNTVIAQGYNEYTKSYNFGRRGGAIYNDGNLYIGYSNYESETNNTKVAWTGECNYNYAATGGAIYNASSGYVKMRTGSLVYNASGSSGLGGGAIYNLGTFEMTEDALVDYNKSTSKPGGGIFNAAESGVNGTFIFSGGTISHNFTTNGNGGGIYNKGILRIYGDAVIGAKSETKAASGNGWKNAAATGSTVTYSADACSNYATGYGGGICTEGGEVYLGYDGQEWTGGIYYNYAKSSSTNTSNCGGGGIAVRNTSAVVVMNSGTIACNATEGSGNAVYLYGNGFTIGGDISIPAGTDNKQDIYYPSSSCYINIAQNLNAGPGSISLSPYASSDKSSYNTTNPVIKLTDDATGFTIPDVKDKFTITPLVRTKDGFTTNWVIDDNGYVKQNAVPLEVSASGNSFTNVIAQINNPLLDYIINVDGTVSGPVTLPDTIQANSITIQGKNSSSTTLKGTIDASGSSTGSALTIETTIPVVINGLLIKGGKGTSNSSETVGGGIFIKEGCSVIIDKYSKITENSADKGAGIYVSANAKLLMNTQSEITNNTAVTKGAGIYVAADGYLRIIQNSECHVSYNKFIQGSDQVMGGGVYLEDNAVMEQYGGYIHDNELNTDFAAGGLGSGVYVSSSSTSSSASYKILGYADLTYRAQNVPNDIYLAGNTKIEISASMNSGNTPRRITLQNYEENRELFTLASGVSSSITYMNYFEVTPQTLSDGQKQYWAIEENTGKLIKSSGMGITVSIPSGQQNDIQVEVTLDGAPVQNNTHLTGGSELVFTVKDAENYEEFEWYVDGVDVDEYSSYDSSFDFYNSGYGFAKGIYVVYLEAKDSDGNYYSYTAQVKVE